MKARRASFRIVFGEGPDRWSFADTAHDVVSEAAHSLRYDPGTPTLSQRLVCADTLGDLHYLIHVCPTTKLACEKLAQIRRAVRELGEEPKL